MDINERLNQIELRLKALEQEVFQRDLLDRMPSAIDKTPVMEAAPERLPVPEPTPAIVMPVPEPIASSPLIKEGVEKFFTTNQLVSERIKRNYMNSPEASLRSGNQFPVFQLEQQFIDYVLM
jgi:hypothetical protein